jgi:small subunit ribosomal protein S6
LPATTTPEYELILMLDPEAPDERREQIVADARSRIETAGNLKQDTGWGMRKLAYEIQQRTEADYRFFRFESDPPLLESLDHELKIADGVLRFRIFKVDPRSPMIVPPAPTPGSGTPPRAWRRPGPGARPAEEETEAAESAAPEAEAAATAEAPPPAAAEAATPAEAPPAEAPPGEAAAPAPEPAEATEDEPAGEPGEPPAEQT